MHPHFSHDFCDIFNFSFIYSFAYLPHVNVNSTKSGILFLFIIISLKYLSGQTQVYTVTLSPTHIVTLSPTHTVTLSPTGSSPYLVGTSTQAKPEFQIGFFDDVWVFCFSACIYIFVLYLCLKPEFVSSVQKRISRFSILKQSWGL